MDLSVSIVSWNTRDLLDRCIQSVYETTSGIEFEVIVVDNASSDGCAQMIREKHPQIILIENADNVGFARANNQAYAVSTGRHILLLNPDTVVLGDALRNLVEFLDNHDRAGAVGPLVLNNDGSLQYSWARFPTLWSEVIGKLDRRIEDLTRRPENVDEARRLQPFRADWVGGCCLMIQRQAVGQIGPMDESLFMYCEETDWCLRLHDAGWEVWVQPDSSIVHLGGKSSDHAPLETRRHLMRSKAAYFAKHAGRPMGWLLGTVLWTRFALSRFLGRTLG